MDPEVEMESWEARVSSFWTREGRWVLGNLVNNNGKVIYSYETAKVTGRIAGKSEDDDCYPYTAGDLQRVKRLLHAISSRVRK